MAKANQNIITATNYTSQLAEALRQQKRAEAMQEQADAPIEIQSYKGVQAPIPWTALLAKGLGVVGSKVREGRALKRQDELNKFKTEETQRQIANLLAPVAVGEQPGFRPMSNGSQLASALASANAPANVAGMAPTAGAGGMPGAAPNADLAAALGGAGRLSAGGPPGVSMNGPSPGGMPMMPTQAMPPVRPAPMGAPMGAPIAPIQTAAPMAATTRSANSQEMTQRAADAMASPFDTVRALAGNTLERAQGLQDEERKLEQAEAIKTKMANAIKDIDIEGVDNNVLNAYMASPDPSKALDYMVSVGVNAQKAADKLEEIKFKAAEDYKRDQENIQLRRDIADQASADRRMAMAMSSADRRFAATQTAEQRAVDRRQRESELTPIQQTNLMAIVKSHNAVDGAIAAIANAPSAFSAARGAATKWGSFTESLAARRDTPEESQARAQVFNVMSSVIKERAGTAQSKAELQTLNSFLPNAYDTAPVITNKLNGFKKYLAEQEKAVMSVGRYGVQQPQTNAGGGGKAPPPGMDLAAWAKMTPAEREKF